MISQELGRQYRKPMNRMEPDGPSRYLSTDTEIRKHLQKDRQIVAALIVESAMRILKTKYEFSNEELEVFHSDLEKEIRE